MSRLKTKKNGQWELVDVNIKGDAATIKVGTTTSLSSDSQPTVENVGTTSDAIFNFGIPAGRDGKTPEAGVDYWTLTDKQDIINQVLTAHTKHSIEITNDGVSSITVPFTVTDVNQLTVYHNGILLIPSIHYTLSDNSIVLNGYTAEAGDTITFVGATFAAAGGEVSAEGVMLVDAAGNFSGVSSVEGALAKLAENASAIKSISLNTNPLTPNAAGNVNINIEVPLTSVSVDGTKLTINNGDVNVVLPLTSISVNGTDIPISNKKAAITGVATSLSVNGTSYTPNTNGQIALSNVMFNTTGTTTLSGPMVAQSNTNYSTAQVRNVIMGTADPTSSIGSDGDIYIKYEA